MSKQVRISDEAYAVIERQAKDSFRSITGQIDAMTRSKVSLRAEARSFEPDEPLTDEVLENDAGAYHPPKSFDLEPQADKMNRLTAAPEVQEAFGTLSYSEGETPDTITRTARYEIPSFKDKQLKKGSK